MFSSLGPLFKASFRQTEQTDTRQSIIREEKEEGRRKKREENPVKDDEFWEDSTSVSVDALRTFLMNFLKGATLTDKIRENETPPPVRMPEERTPADTRTARALDAYQSMAEKTRASTPPPDMPAPQSEVDLVTSEEIRLMHELIKDLEILSARGVETLKIEPAGSFLAALRNAIIVVK